MHTLATYTRAEEFMVEEHALRLGLPPNVMARMASRTGGSAAGGSPAVNPDERECDQ